MKKYLIYNLVLFVLFFAQCRYENSDGANPFLNKTKINNIEDLFKEANSYIAYEDSLPKAVELYQIALTITSKACLISIIDWDTAI